jgi:hypothetical protein
VIKLVSYLRQVDGFLRVLRFPPPIKLTTTIYLNIVEIGSKNHKPTIQNPIEKSQKDAKSVLLTQLHDHSFFWLRTGSSIKMVGLN